MFAKVQEHDMHNVHANFRTFWRGFITLIRCMTGEAWNEMMHSFARGPREFGMFDSTPCATSMRIGPVADADKYMAVLTENCLTDTPMECGNSSMAYFFFLSYTWVIMLVVLNLVVAVILEGFEDSAGAQEDEIVNLAIDNWKKYDPTYTLQLDPEDAHKFIDEIELDLLSDEEKRVAAQIELTPDEVEFLKIVPQEGNEGKVTFVDVVSACLRQVMLKTQGSKEDRLNLMEELKVVQAGIELGEGDSAPQINPAG
jgi:hypothetical protein